MKLAAIACAAIIALTATANAAARFSGTVTSVYDGDTFRVDGTPVRLWGIDADELHETDKGRSSAYFLSKWIVGETVVCEIRGASYDRVVAMCWIGNLDIARGLVDAGFAKDWPRYSGGYYAR